LNQHIKILVFSSMYSFKFQSSLWKTNCESRQLMTLSLPPDINYPFSPLSFHGEREREREREREKTFDFLQKSSSLHLLNIPHTQNTKVQIHSFEPCYEFQMVDFDPFCSSF